METVSDGTSNTLLFLEIIGGGLPYTSPLPGLPSGNSGNLNVQHTWAGSGALGTKFGLQPPPPGGGGPGWQFYSSFHSGNIVNGCYADGSVRPLKTASTGQRNPAGTSWYVLQALAGMRDGQTPDFSMVAN